MWTHRRFTWRYTPHTKTDLTPLVAQVCAMVGALVQATPQFYRDAKIGGMAFGVLEFSVTISDRDQWWVGRRARLLVDKIRTETSIPLDLVIEVSEKLPVHMNRGKWHLRRAARERNG